MSYVKVESRADAELSDTDGHPENSQQNEEDEGAEAAEERAMEECESGADEADNEGALRIVSGSEQDDEDASGDDVSNTNRYGKRENTTWIKPAAHLSFFF